MWFKDITIRNNWIQGIAGRDVDSGAITLTKATNSPTVTASSSIFTAAMADYHTGMTIAVDGHLGDGWSWAITNFISSTQVQVASTFGDTNATFTITDDDCQIAQIESEHFADQTSYTNSVWANNVFVNVRGALNDSNDGMKLYHNLFYNSPKASAFISTGGGTRGSSYGTLWYGNMFSGVGLSDANDGGWYGNGLWSVVSSNTTAFGNYNMVRGSAGSAKQVAPPHDEYHWASTTPLGATEANGINGGTPGWVDDATFNFHVASTNSLIHEAAQTGYVTDDFWGTDRPATPSIGPFEMLGAAAAEEPPASTINRVISGGVTISGNVSF
jgi:hypothetical protein